jgi:hypothetical protein
MQAIGEGAGTALVPFACRSEDLQGVLFKTVLLKLFQAGSELCGEGVPAENNEGFGA